LYNEIPSSVNETNDNANVKIYPNPAKDKIFIGIYGEINDELKIGLYNQLGMDCGINYEIKTQEQSNIIEMNTKSLANGVYFLKVQAGLSCKAYKIIINK
jgi:hypothetical protein